MANTIILFAEKNVRSFCKSYLHVHVRRKNINVFENTLATTANKFVVNQGPVVQSKLTMSLVNDSLKCTSSDTQIC